MAVLIQEVICGDYAFVIQTKNPLSGIPVRYMQRIVKGLGETLVRAYPGRAMSFFAKKCNLKFPIVTGYPSKNRGLYSKPPIYSGRTPMVKIWKDMLVLGFMTGLFLKFCF
ncbi:hypothetical protein NC653_006156 [Populus alba x Populus x berolinensis]|uniref:Uncharacterized protein n=1 Tax=Populus alba x Populus x berolinensis TaxID=444605 RepID=A0AAD6RDJ4_9ROSI|nr:hypothetical protein NC653_006156 [Populus alba x Populus x berolinensis]